MHLFIICIIFCITAVIGNSTTPAPVSTPATEEIPLELPIEAMNCINDFKALHTKWNTIKEECKHALPHDRTPEGLLALLSKTSFQKCLSEVLKITTEIEVTGKKCRDIGKTMSNAQRIQTAKLFRESIS